MKTFQEFLDICEGFKPMNEPKMQNQIKRHSKRDDDKRERGKRGDNSSNTRFNNMRNALNVIGTQQKSKGFKEKKTEKGKRTFAKQNADKFLRKDDWHGGKDRLGYKLTVPGRHILRDEEGHKKHVERLIRKKEKGDSQK